MTTRNDLIRYLNDMKIDANSLIPFEQTLGYPFFGIEVDILKAREEWLFSVSHLKDSSWRPVLVSGQSELAKMAESKPPKEAANGPLDAVLEIGDVVHDVRLWPNDEQTSGNGRQRLLRLEGRGRGVERLSAGDAISFGLKLDFHSWMETKAETDALWNFMQDTPWNAAEENHEETIASLSFFDFFNDSIAPTKALLLYLPVKNSYYMPALFGFGGWNDCPPSQVHVCVLSHLHEVCGAEVLAIGHDRLDLWVNTPLTTQEAAMNVAKELFVYCPDLVHQGDGTLSRVAAQIYGSKIWSFWWD